MRTLKLFLQYPGADQVLLLRAAATVLGVRAGLLILPFEKLRRKVLRSKRRDPESYPMERLAWAVSAVSRRLPGSTCLVQALACQKLLVRSGYDSRLEIGVAKDEEVRFAAHAWVVCGRRIVIGGSEAPKYVPLGAGMQRS